jgi:hypothetical protein
MFKIDNTLKIEGRKRRLLLGGQKAVRSTTDEFSGHEPARTLKTLDSACNNPVRSTKFTSHGPWSDAPLASNGYKERKVYKLSIHLHVCLLYDNGYSQ